MEESKSLLSRVVKWIVIGVLAVLAIKIIGRLLAFLLGLMGMAVGIVGFLLFTVGPIVLLGWLAMKAWKAFAKEPV
jgi:hypothetical protein